MDLGHELGAAKTNLTIAKSKYEDAKLKVTTHDDALKEFCSDSAKARWTFNFLVARTQPPPLVAATKDSPIKLQTIIALGKSESGEFDILAKLITLMKTLHDAKKNRNTIGDDVKMKNDAMQEVEVKHNKARQRLAVLIWDGEKYLEEATKVDAVPDGRVAATPAKRQSLSM